MFKVVIVTIWIKECYILNLKVVEVALKSLPNDTEHSKKKHFLFYKGKGVS